MLNFLIRELILAVKHNPHNRMVVGPISPKPSNETCQSVFAGGWSQQTDVRLTTKAIKFQRQPVNSQLICRKRAESPDVEVRDGIGQQPVALGAH